MSIPIVIFHLGDSHYLKDVVEFNVRNAPVILIGNEKNAYIGSIPNARHIDYKELQDTYLDFLKSNFLELEKGLNTKQVNVVNADFAVTNIGTYEFLCFARVYFIKQLMERENLDLVCHLDSDAFLLEPTIDLADALGKRLAYGIEHIHNNIHMVGSIHNAFLTKEFCKVFLQLYEDVYVTGTKRKLLEHKVMCIQNKIGGGRICDMNFYYMLWQQKLLELVDLSQPFLYKGELSVFDHCLNNSTGFEGGQTYQTTRDELGPLKKLFLKQGKVYQTTKSGKEIRLLSLHFNSQDKHRIARFKQLLTQGKNSHTTQPLR